MNNFFKLRLEIMAFGAIAFLASIIPSMEIFNNVFYYDITIELCTAGNCPELDHQHWTPAHYVWTSVGSILVLVQVIIILYKMERGKYKIENNEED